jgi:hypothetical protein
MNEVTQLLSALDQGDPQVASRLLPQIYDEQRKLAAQRMAQEQPGQTLQPTALVHEAYLRLGGHNAGAAARFCDVAGKHFRVRTLVYSSLVELLFVLATVFEKWAGEAESMRCVARTA